MSSHPPAHPVLPSHSQPGAEATDPAIISHFRQTRFMTSAPRLSLCPVDSGWEVAFAGRSNAGKSSALNALTHQRQLARASKTPGRTQLINFFCTGEDESRRLVDLPGYGYAAVPETLKKQWQVELARYLGERQSLNGLVLLMDIRHPLTDYDSTLLEWARARQLFVHVLLTKADKLNRGPANNTLLAVRKTLMTKQLDFSIQLFSALQRQGITELAQVLATRLQLQTDQPDQTANQTA